MFTVDASVHVNALNREEEGSRQSRAFLETLHRGAQAVYSPTLLLVEVAAAVSRAVNDPEQAVAMAQSIRDLPGQVWIPLDVLLAEESTHLAAVSRLRGADAVYAAVASRYKTTLVTRDRQQLERLRPTLPILTPEEAAPRLD